MARLWCNSVLALLMASGAWADSNSAKPATTPPAARPGARPAPPGGGHRLNNPLNPAQRFLQMTPEEQERLMERANPQQQERMRAALERYNSLPPAARERLFRQYEVLKELPVSQQALISRQFQAFNQLPDDRRWMVGQELIRLHRMPPEERDARIAGEEFAARYSPAEQQILRDLGQNLPPDYPLAGR